MLLNEDLFPTPDYHLYRDLAEELDTISWRIRKLTEALKLVGIYDASAPQIGNVLNSDIDGTMHGVDNMAALLGKSTQTGGGLSGIVQWLPMDFVINALQGLYLARDQVKAAVYEVSAVYQTSCAGKWTRERRRASLKSRRSLPRSVSTRDGVPLNGAPETRPESRSRSWPNCTLR